MTWDKPQNSHLSLTMVVSDSPPAKEELEVSPNEPTHDVVFGEITEDGPNYRNVSLSLAT